MSALTSACALARACYGAAAVSVAVVEEDALHYVAADGAGADSIVGTRLAAGRGIAGFAAATGQSLTVRDPSSDPRFARDVGASTGYLPSTIQCVPVDVHGEVVAVISILDRATSDERADSPVALERLVELVGALLASGDGGDGVAARLDRLEPDDRAAAVTAIGAILDALDR